MTPHNITVFAETKSALTTIQYYLEPFEYNAIRMEATLMPRGVQFPKEVDNTIIIAATTADGSEIAVALAAALNPIENSYACLFCLSHIDSVTVAQLEHYVGPAVVTTWQTAYKNLADMLQRATFLEQSLPERFYRTVAPDWLSDDMTKETPLWDGQERVRVVMQSIHAPLYAQPWSQGRHNKLEMVCITQHVKKSYEAILECDPHVLVCDPCCLLKLKTDVPITYHPEWDIPTLLKVRPNLKIMVYTGSTYLPLLRLVDAGMIQTYLPYCDENETNFQTFVQAAARGETVVTHSCQKEPQRCGIDLNLPTLSI